MLPILFIHGYSSEGHVDHKQKSGRRKARDIQSIYGELPKRLQEKFGDDKIQSLNLSRWISLDDGVSIDDISFAMDRALKSKQYKHLLQTGFHVVIHSTGALVVRNWIKNFSPMPSPIKNLVHLAGANFGSGLAHIGRGQLARWWRFIMSTEPGEKVLTELEFGNSKTLDLHCHFLKDGQKMYEDYQVQEFCLIGSQVGSGVLKPVLETIPIRYVKEDSSDNTVRTSASNLNFNYVVVKPLAKAYSLTTKTITNQIENREENLQVSQYYEIDKEQTSFAADRIAVPFALLYDTAHFGKDIGIVFGKKTLNKVSGLITSALKTSHTLSAYDKLRKRFDSEKKKTLDRAARSKRSFILGWNKQAQYEGHTQVIVRLRDQYGVGVKHYDITFNSQKPKKGDCKLECMIEDAHKNKKEDGIITFYLRTAKFFKQSKTIKSIVDTVAPLDLEITAYEKGTDRIAFVPLKYHLDKVAIKAMFQSFKTTVIDIELVRLPANEVFDIIKTR